jgi:hypothetical protein
VNGFRPGLGGQKNIEDEQNSVLAQGTPDWPQVESRSGAFLTDAILIAISFSVPDSSEKPARTFRGLRSRTQKKPLQNSGLVFVSYYCFSLTRRSLRT